MARGRKQALTPSASPLHFFGSEVRRAREVSGMTLGELGALVPCDPSTVSRIEAGILAPDAHFAKVCDEAFPSSGGWFTRFYLESREWGESFPPPFRPFAQDESDATALYAFEHSLIPGLLQTEAYARAVLSRHPNVSDEQVNERVAARLERQAVLDRATPPLLWVVIDDAVLNRRVGSQKITHDALLHLAAMSRRPNINIQVLEDVGAYVGLQGSFVIAEMAGAGGSVNLEDASDGRLADDAPTLAEMSVRFRWLQSEALSATASRDLIERIAEERWNT